jgi:uncharacterized protein DUF5361
VLQTYGVDVLDPAVSLRRVHVLATRLAGGSQDAESQVAWTIEAHLLAAMFDAVMILTWVTLKANGAKGAQRPKPIRRPGPRPGRPGGQPAERKVQWSGLVEALRAQGAVIGNG